MTTDHSITTKNDLQPYTFYSITPEQERLWLEWKLNPNAHGYNVTIQARIAGPLDSERLYEAALASIQYFEPFRSFFSENRGLVQQIVKPEVQDAIHCHDLTQNEDLLSVREESAKAILKMALQEPFDLTKAPLIRYTIIRCAEEVYYFSFVLPHIICDHGGGATILRFISDAYNLGIDKCIQGYESAKEGETAEYFSYTTNYYSSEERAAAKAHWLEETNGSQPKLNFKHFLSGANISNRGSRQYFHLNDLQIKAIRSLARQHRTTPFAVLMAAFNVLLYRYFGQSDITVGYPVNLRPSHLKRLPHFFTNTLPLRVNLKPKMTFSDLVNVITEKRKKDKKYQALPYGEIIKAMRTNGISYKNARLNVMFAQTHFGLESYDLVGCQATQIPPDYDEVNYDLSLVYDISNSPYLFGLEYKLDIFNNLIISEMVQHFLQILNEVTENNTIAIEDVSFVPRLYYNTLITKEEIAHVTIDKNLSHHAFEKQCRLTPGAIALSTTDGESLSYHDLELKANDLAQKLIKLGVRPGDRIAIIQTRSIEQIISILAVMKTGGVYVPINPSQPIQRIQAILSECDTSITLLNTEAEKKISGYLNNVLVVDKQSLSASERPDSSLNSESPAYILFTSGSTGTPKGVVVSHSNINSRLTWFKKKLDLKLYDRILNRINIWFDPSVYEILGTLSTGARLVIPTENEIRNTKRFIQVINEQEISVTNTVPSQLTDMLKYIPSSGFRNLRCVIAGGEALQPKLKCEFKAALPSVQLLNMYGPTECTIMATCEDCSIPSGANNKISIGYPIDGTEVYILNEALKIQPNGAEGEICISGAGVAIGYYNSPEATHNKFIKHPYISDYSLYRTGDMGIKIPSGELLFLGRKDQQIKIRGYRVELNEIEQALCMSFDFEVAVVAIKEPESKLVGYIQTNNEKPTSAQLKEKLEKILPDHMIPSEFMYVVQMPLTDNGKVDRVALLKLELKQTDVDYCIASFSQTEERIALLWAKFLAIPMTKIHPHSTFFDLGGDSFETVNMAMILEHDLGIPIPAEMVFEYPTIRKLAEKIDGSQEQKDSLALSLPGNRRMATETFKKRQKAYTA